MLLLYNLLSTMALLFYLPVLVMKGRSGNGLRYIKERLGMDSYQKADIWVHSVSLGETMAILPFLKRLKAEFPDRRIVLSTTTHTGQRLAMEGFQGADRIMYMPWDSWACMKRVIDLISPDLFITVETELWPVLFNSLKKRGSRIILLNGRISERSFKGYMRIRPFMKRVLANVDHIYMQTPLDARRILALGADDARVRVMGNLKFDIQIDGRETPGWIQALRKRILLAGSTHRGEDELILDAYQVIRRRFDDVSLILAPRHPERFDDVEGMLRGRGFNYIRRTAIEKGDLHTGRLYDILLLDTIGELSWLFSIATIAFVGGSLLPYGGHNILEPAYWGKPIIFGPHMDNFPFARDFLDGSAAIMVRDAKDLAGVVIELLEEPERAEGMGRRARAMIEKHRGATDRALRLIHTCLVH
jgi:3-deoxy-D-manno-octulosonic-acid transferase